MASFTNSSIKSVYKDILHTSNSNTGIGSTIKQITCGDGDTTALYLSDRNLKSQPSTDTTTNTVIYDADGNALLTVDSTNDLVKAGIGQHTVNTQYAKFGISSVNASLSAGTHYALPFNNQAGLSGEFLSLGTATNPSSTVTVSTEAPAIVEAMWYVMDDITIDRVVWWSGSDANNSGGDVATRAHLLQYDVVASTTEYSGDLSSMTVLADGSDIANAGYEQAYYQQLTIQSANVDAGKDIMFAFRYDSTTGTDYSVNATIKYHLR